MSSTKGTDTGKRGKKRSKAYYKKCAAGNKRRKFNLLEPGIKGFLVTCNSREKDAVRETYNILNDFADQLYGPEEVPKKNNEEIDDGGGDSDEDIETALKREVDSLKETAKSKDRRFQNIDTKANNCIFIRTTLAEPNELAHAIFNELYTSKKQRSRYAIRLLPVSMTCRASIADINNTCKKLFIKDFETPFGQGLGFSIMFKMRNNSGINRGDVQESLGNIIKELNPLHHVDFTSPDIVISVDIIGSVCCLAVVRDFYKFRKYNLQEVVREIVDTEEITPNEITKKDSDKSEDSKKCDDNADDEENLNTKVEKTEVTQNVVANGSSIVDESISTSGGLENKSLISDTCEENAIDDKSNSECKEESTSDT